MANVKIQQRDPAVETAPNRLTAGRFVGVLALAALIATAIGCESGGGGGGGGSATSSGTSRLAERDISTLSLLERVDLIRDPAPLSQMAVLFGEPFFETPAKPLQRSWNDPPVSSYVTRYLAYWKLCDEFMLVALVGNATEERTFLRQVAVAHSDRGDSVSASWHRSKAEEIRGAGAESVRNGFGDWIVQSHRVEDERSASADRESYTYTAWMSMPQAGDR